MIAFKPSDYQLKLKKNLKAVCLAYFSFKRTELRRFRHGVDWFQLAPPHLTCEPISRRLC
jgi:hypothetical protein